VFVLGKFPQLQNQFSEQCLPGINDVRGNSLTRFMVSVKVGFNMVMQYLAVLLYG